MEIKKHVVYLQRVLTEWASSHLKKTSMKKFSSVYFGISLLAMMGESEHLWWYLVVGANLIVSFLLFKKYNKEYVL